MFDFLRIFIRFFDQHNIPYMLSGNTAMSTYTVPRFTRDFDFIVHLKPADAQLLTATFTEGFTVMKMLSKKLSGIKGCLI